MKAWLILLSVWSCLNHGLLWAQDRQEGRRLALLVGIGSYANPKIPTLRAPPHDVDLMVRILSGINGYGFHRDDMVVLKNERATLETFRSNFEKKLIQEARSGDIVLIYFSGHGSRYCDLNGDEPNDPWDETLVFYDSRTGGKGDLIDDELGSLIARIPARHVVLILDACHSGSGDRGGLMAAKVLDPIDCETLAPGPGFPGGKKDHLMISPDRRHAGLVVISAVADDIRSAYEREKKSNLTAWLAAALTQSTGHTLTYEQLAVRVRTRISDFGQTPAFKGALGKTVFDAVQKLRPIAWLVSDISEDGVYAQGRPMPGWSLGGVVDLYDAGISGQDYAQSEKILATMTIAAGTGNRVLLRSSSQEVAACVRVGDYVVLNRPGEDLYRLRVSLRPSFKKGGIPKDQAAAITDAIEKSREVKGLIGLVERDAEYEVVRDHQGYLQIIGPEGITRSRVNFRSNNAGPLMWNLWLFALQRHLKQLPRLHPEHIQEGALSLSLVFGKGGAERVGRRPYSDDEGKLHLPVGSEYRIEVAYPLGKGSESLSIGGVILSSDGSVYGFPSNGDYPLLKPGGSHTFEQVFKTAPPLGLDEWILVFGTSVKNPTYWHFFQHSAHRISPIPRGEGYQNLVDFLIGNRRDRQVNNNRNSWTITGLSHRVVK